MVTWTHGYKWTCQNKILKLFFCNKFNIRTHDRSVRWLEGLNPNLNILFWHVNLRPCGHVSLSKFTGDTMRAITRCLAHSVIVWECCHFFKFLNWNSNSLAIFHCDHVFRCLTFLQKTFFWSVNLWPCGHVSVS